MPVSLEQLKRVTALPIWAVLLTWCFPFAVCLAILPGQLLAQDGPTSAPPAAANSGSTKPSPPLPPGFTPPREIPPVMTLEKEMMTKKEDDEFRAEQIKYQSALPKGVLNDETEKLIERGARWRLYKMTLKANRHELDRLRRDVTRDVKFASASPGAPPDAREYLLKVITKIAGELLASNEMNFYVRHNLVVLLSELSLTDANPSKKLQEVAYTPAAVPLLAVLNDGTQLVAIKLAAVQGLMRICRIGEPIQEMRYRIASAFVNELEKKPNNPNDRIENHWWYQMRLAEGLGAVGIVNNLQRQPFVVNALMNALVDPSRHWLVRSEAAKSLGRVRLEDNASINVRLVVFEIANLGMQMSQAIRQKPDAVYWKPCFFNLYLAFHHFDAAEREKGAGLLLEVKQKAGLARYAQIVRDAYSLLLPLIQNVVQKTVVAAALPEQIQKVSDWLEKNQPDDFRVHPQFPPINTSKSESKPISPEQPAASS